MIDEEVVEKKKGKPRGRPPKKGIIEKGKSFRKVVVENDN